MEYWTAIWQSMILGTVQGLTEFLPVSSSGHLELLHRLMGADFGGNTLFVDIILHLGTLLAVVVVLRKEIAELFRKPFSRLFMLVAATVPAGLTGLLFRDGIDSLMQGSGGVALLALFFAITAVLLITAQTVSERRKHCVPLGWKHALLMGAAQACALFPGISRSGSTIVAGVLSGAEKRDVARFSFLMSIPIILASALLSVIDVVQAPETVTTIGGAGFVGIAVGFVCSAVSGFFAVKWMLRIVQNADYKWFSLYLLLLSAICITLSCAGIL